MALTPQQEALLEEAQEAAKHAYAPASGFRVGAALKTKRARYTGFNIENASLGLSICAERLAVFRAISEGDFELSEMVVISASGVDAPPCGACRQVLAEFAPEIRITYKHLGEFVTKTVEELLPDRFQGSTFG